MSLRVNEAERVSLPLSLMQTQEAPILSLIALLFFFFFSVYYNLLHPQWGHAQAECRPGQT